MAIKLPAPVNILRADYARSTYFTLAPEGVSLADVMSPDYWVHVRGQFRAGDVIEVVAADGSFDVDLRILSLSAVSGAISFRTIREAPKTVDDARLTLTPAVVATSAFEVRHTGHGKYCVLEIGTGKVVSDGLTKDQANEEKATLEKQRLAA